MNAQLLHIKLFSIRDVYILSSSTKNILNRLVYLVKKYYA